MLGNLIDYASEPPVECPLLKIAFTHMAVESQIPVVK